MDPETLTAPSQPEAASPEIAIRLLRRDDLRALEWSAEHVRYRRLFLSAFNDMEAGTRVLFVATADQGVVGRVFVQLDSTDTRYADGVRRGYLYALRVRPESQRKGIGTRLVAAAEAELRARGFRWAAIAVGKENPGALRLYHRLGYAIFSEDPGIWYFTDDQGNVRREHEPSWIMQKPLVV
jgi:ribosomal protein S18 acetylase RimI-like enzyme